MPEIRSTRKEYNRIVGSTLRETQCMAEIQSDFQMLDILLSSLHTEGGNQSILNEVSN